MGAIVRLEWVRYPDGFDLTDDWSRVARQLGWEVDPKAGAGRFLVPRKPERSERYVIEGTSSRVFIALANIQDDDASVLAFVDRWGLLRRPNAQYEAGRGSPIALARLMRDAIDDLARDPAGEPTHSFMMPRMRLRRAKLTGDSAPRVFLQPDDLFAFCCAELLQLAEAGTEIRTCPRCGTLFAIGKVGKPPRYCSDACKVAMHRKRRREAELRASNSVRLRGRAGG